MEVSKYTIFCVIQGEWSPFSVKVSPNATVDELKKLIKAENPDDFPKIAAKELTLYRVDITGSTENERHDAVVKAELSIENKLDALDSLIDIYNEPPPTKTIHIVVQTPSSPVEPKSIDKFSELSFRASKKGEFRTDLNDIHECPLLPPSYVQSFADALAQARDVRANDLTVKSFPEKDYSAKPTLVIPVTSDNSREPLTAEQTIELAHYMNVGVRQPVVDAWSSLYREDKEKFFHGHYLWSVEQYLLNRNFSLTSGRGPITFEQNKSWGYTLIADIKFEPKSKPESRPEIEKKYSHSPRSDWQLKIQDTPCLHIEVTSDPRGERDKERMLIQAACLVRLVNKHQYAGEPKFVDVCIYIDASLRASRYLVYQPLAGEPRIEFVVRQFDLTTERGRVQFLIELYNFPLAAQHWNFEKVKDFKILQAAKNLVLEGFTNTTNPGSSNKGRRTDTSQSRDHSSRGSTARGSDSTHPYDDPSVEERLSQNGYHLIKDIKLPGWTRLNPLKSTLCEAERSDGKLVVLKLVKRGSHEIAIHRMLNATQSPFNHTIALLDELTFEFGTIIATPYAMVLPLAPNSMFVKSCQDLVRQFLEGVAFMHQQLVAHLDLKPHNVVIADAQTCPRIFIIDFGTSVRVNFREELITGYRGTAGWVAPEVGWHETPDQIFSPISADLWACGKMLRWFCSRSQDSHSPEIIDFTRLATELMDSEPQNRPILTLPFRPRPVFRGVKRKLETSDDKKNQRLRLLSYGEITLGASDGQPIITEHDDLTVDHLFL